MSETPSDLHALPPDLPVPEDDGAADHLPGARVPSIALLATDGERVDLAAAAAGDGFLVVYVYQREFAAREYLPYPLLNDSGFRLVEELGLPTFEAHGALYYRRLTFIARRGRIAKVLYPVFPPQDNAADVIAWLRSVGPARTSQT